MFGCVTGMARNNGTGSKNNYDTGKKTESCKKEKAEWTAYGTRRDRRIKNIPL
jgi:hypothetical protein